MYLGYMNWSEYAAQQKKLAPQRVFQYTSYYKEPTVAPQCTCSQLHGMGQIGPAATAISSLIGPVASLISGKKHYSPWGFLYDDYPMHIGENEQNIVALKNAINKIQGGPQITPPPQVNRNDWQQSLSVMKQIVPQYVAGQESALNSNSRTLNESGGGYEQTYARQAALIPQLQSQLQQLQMKQAATPAAPASATLPPLPSAPLPQLMAPPATVYPAQAQYAPQPISITTAAPSQQADMMGQLGPYLPYIIGGAALLLALLVGQSHNDNRGRKV